MDKSKLQAAIRAAFEDVPYPGDNNIGIPGGFHDAENVTRWFRGKDWRSLASEDLWVEGLNWMTPEACHYYLPGYLLSALEDTTSEGAMKGLLFSLDPSYTEGPEPSDEFLKIVSLLSSAQKQVLREFLVSEQNNLIEWQAELRKSRPDLGAHFFRDRIAALCALIDYWGSV